MGEIGKRAIAMYETRRSKFREFVLTIGLISAAIVYAGVGGKESQAQTKTRYELLPLIERLDRDQILILREDSQVVIDGLTSDIQGPELATWTCKWDGGIGGGASFVKCTKKVVDTSGCAILVPHKEGYCSKPC
jgi:hypothetical protein